MKVIVASSIDTTVIEKMSEEHDVLCRINPDANELKSAIVDREVLILRSGVQISEDVMACAPDLKLIIRAGCGLDNIDVPYAKSRGIELHSIPQPAAFSVSEMTFALMLALARRILEADESRRAGRWIKTELKGRLLYGKTLGIVGVGNIGSRVAQLGNSLGMNVVGCVEFPTAERAEEYKKKDVTLTDLKDVASQADFLTIHVPKKESTKYLINAEILSLMKKDSFLVNIARGGVVDESALYKVMTESDRLLGVALDVHEEEGEGLLSPFREMKNVILTPHIGSMTVDTYKDMGQRILKIFNDFSSREQEVQTRAAALA